MAIISKTVTIAETATLIHTSASNGCHIYISHDNGGHPVTIGPATVVAGAGVTLSGSGGGNQYINGPLPPGDSIYGITTAGNTQAIGVTIVEF